MKGTKNVCACIMCVCGIYILSCGSAGLIRTDIPLDRSGKPKITGITDLGGLPIPSTGPVSAGESDGIITPGEWIALNGDNISKDTIADIDGAKLPVQGYFNNGSILLRIPRGLSPRGEHRVTVKNPGGESSFSFTIRSYIVSADFDGENVRAIPTIPAGKKYLSEKLSKFNIGGAMACALTAEGSLLAIAGGVDKENIGSGINSKIIIVNMAARNHPEEIARFNTPVTSWPTALAFIDEHTLAVVSRSSFVIVDIFNPQNPAILGSVDLSKEAKSTERTIPQYLNEIAILGNGKCALMDAVSNRIIFAAVEKGNIRVDSVFDVPESGDLPYSIDIAADPDDPDRCILLQGPNLRVGGEKISRFIKSFSESSADGGKKEEVRVPCRILKITSVSGHPSIVTKRTLSDKFFPMYLCAGKNDQQYVSGINSDVLDFAGVDLSIKGAGRVVDVMKNTVQLGRVIKISGNTQQETVVQGMALYFNIDTLGDEAVYSIIRAGYRVLPPSVTAEWGIEVRKGGYVMLKRLELKSLIPPYSVPVFVSQ